MDASKPMPVKMNWEERARRAEALAEHFASIIRGAARVLQIEDETRQPPAPKNAGMIASMLREADRWHAHRADLDTLEQEAAR